MTNRTRGMTLAAGLAIAAWGFTTTASAQGRGDRGGPGGWGGSNGQPDMARLIANPAVQEDLKLTDKQKKQIEVVRADGQKQMETLRTSMPRRDRGDNNNNGGNGNGGGQPQFDREAMMANMMVMRANVETAYSKILDAKQRKRLGEIALRQEGPRAVARPEIALKLNMSEAQLAEVQTVILQGRQVQGQLFASQRSQMMQGLGGRENNGGNQGRGNGGDGNGGGRPDWTKMQEFFKSKEGQAQMAKAQEQRKSADDQIIAGIAKVLTKKQRAGFDRMLGEPFDVEKLRGGRGPGGTPGGATEAATKAQEAAKASEATKASTKADEATKATPTKASQTRRRTPA